MADEFPFAVIVEGKWNTESSKLKNKLTLYFSSVKKSNGGECRVKHEASDSQRATVSFKSEQVRQNVLAKKHHEIKLGDVSVTLNVHIPESEADTSQKTESSVSTNQTEKTSAKYEEPATTESGPAEGSSRRSAVIENIQTMNKEMLVMLVENILKNRSDLNFKVEVIPESNCAVVTFAKIKDAKDFILFSPDNSLIKKKNLKTRFLEMTTKKTESSVSTNQTEKTYAKDEEPATTESGPAEGSSRRSAVIENIQTMNKEMLVMLVENILRNRSDLNFKVEVIPESNCAVVTFAKIKDAKDFILLSPDNSLIKKKNLKTRFLEMTTKVKLEDVPTNMNSLHITLYFERYCEPSDLQMLDGEQSAIITFEDPKVVNKILENSHQINKQPIKVFPYYDCLGTALYGEERPTLKLPEALTENIDTSVLIYFQEHQKALKYIRDSLAEHFCDLDLKVPCVKISPLPSILQQGLKTRQLIHSWRKRASDAFTHTVSKYKSMEIKIAKNVWAELEVEIRKVLSSEPVTLVSYKDQGTMVIAGLAEDVDRTRAVAQSVITTITPVIQREKESITDKMDMTPSIYGITMPGGLEQEICKCFPKLELKYHTESRKLTFFGLRQEVLESKNKILQEMIGLKKRMVKLHPSVFEFLTKVDQEELIRVIFLSNGINASFEIKDNDVYLVAKTDKDLKDGEDQLKEQLNNTCFDIEDTNVLRMAEWQVLLTSLTSTFNSSVLTIVSDSQVKISGFAESVKVVQKQLSEFVHINAHITELLQDNTTIVKFIKEHKQQDWYQKVKDVTVDIKDATISLGGPRQYVNESKLVFSDLLSSVYCNKVKIDKPGAKKLFKSKESMLVATAMTSMGCLLELVDELDLSQTVHTSDKVKITVNKGDLCFYPVDAVVNAANENLRLEGGLSKALSDAAGPQLQDACNEIIKTRSQLNTGDAVLTKAGGQLRCKYVIHAVGPQYNNSDPQKAVDLLKKAVKNCLGLANKEKCQLIAIPAISSGNFEFPLDLCAGTIVAAIKEFFESVRGSSLTQIFLIDQNDKIINALEAAVQKVYGSTPKVHGTTFKTILNRPWQNQPRSTNDGSLSATTNEGIKINLHKCNIQDTSLDVVVNSISSDLSLTHGEIPNAISKAAGPQLQTLLNQQATAPASIGAIFVTSGCNLKNKQVFHAVAPHYKQGQGLEQTLEKLVNECLVLAEKQKQSSIVFPAIGTGKLGFPKPTVASLMLDSVVKFSKNRTSKHVQEVMFALHPTDTSTIQVFSDEFKLKFNIQSPSTSSSSEGYFSKITSPKTGIYETKVGEVVLQVLAGDITKETTDVIVNSTNDDFTLKSGVSKAILDAAGANVEAECKQLGTQNNNGLIVTQQGNLQCKKIIHVSAKSNPTIINERVKQALEMSVQQNFTSIAFPAIGTGQGGANPGQVADSMLDAFGDFATKTPQSSLKLVRFVIFQAPMLNDFYQSMLQKIVTSPQKNRDTFQRSGLRRYQSMYQLQDIGFEIEEKVVDAALFSICGPSQNAVAETKQWLEKYISDEHGFQSISDPLIYSLSDKDQQRIKDLQRTLAVIVKKTNNAQGATAANSEGVTLTVEGLTKDVLVVVGEIQAMLRTARDERELQKDMETASDLVDWQFKQSGKFTSFNQKTNYDLEQSFLQNAAQVDITFQGSVYKVTLPDGPAVSGGNQMEIRRIDKKANEGLPEEWDAMTDELYKVCPLQSDSNEYKDVLQLFRKTCQNNVLKIERIQNPGMWKNYQNNKQVMEQKNGHQNNEKRLFHGTREDSKEHINKSGFNRSYAGLNATAFGKGTYFALNASYSAQNTYSLPNAQGEKHMYLCRVLSGDYTAGNSTMIVPPNKSTNTLDQYDTVVDNPAGPTIFVVFRDYHAYPEYLITFT
ncbi:poly(ADP-ribose) polymerase family member 14-related sequence 1 [Trichomycterus rosablanca]|uniref:poly(ADP-ribose) polymerase family member 14-related sequence 1 n=1 Tax=Trichomycterus rosablanca TaxID=2290929 RepID=UPI002F35E62E